MLLFHHFLAFFCCLFLLHSFTAKAGPDQRKTDTNYLLNLERIINANKEPQNWLAIGRDYNEQFYSPLTDINNQTVKDLGLAWVYDLDTNRGQEASPLIVDGVMYFSTAWSKVKALNAVTGKVIWQFDPKVDPIKASQACCDAVNRGIAVWEDKIYVATLDGRLIALNITTGESIWDVMTIPQNSFYTSTGAPRAANGRIFIGNGGAEYGARGYVTAYDAQTGKQLWRFYTVPGDPSKPQENPILEMAKKTWNGEWWKNGGGGTVWDAIVYDPDFDQLYIGVGNGGPHNPTIRSPGGGDNLFVGSIVALNPNTGDYLWHFQATPNDAWDFTSTQPIMLADLVIQGQNRKVLMQAPKNGFFYVLDRETGKFISGEPFAAVNWAKGLDKNGRPIFNPEALYFKTGKPFLTRPGPAGAHSWQPMAYHPGTGLVYIPVMESPFISMGSYQMEGGTNSAILSPEKNSPQISSMLKDMRKTLREDLAGYLLAWDPISQTAKWRVDREVPFNSGVLATAGNLVFQGDGNGEFAAYDATTGKQVWSYNSFGGIIAAPSAYSVDGIQYISVIQGWGGGFSLLAGDLAQLSGPKRNISRVLTFKLGGMLTLPEPPPIKKLTPPTRTGNPKSIAVGRDLFQANCRRCHGSGAIAGGTVPDLRHSPIMYSEDALYAILNGALTSRGMPSFTTKLSKQEMSSIRDYIISEANDAL
jgi:quinohemoprotein ethanol dehydrogenase